VAARRLELAGAASTTVSHHSHPIASGSSAAVAKPFKPIASDEKAPATSLT